MPALGRAPGFALVEHLGVGVERVPGNTGAGNFISFQPRLAMAASPTSDTLIPTIMATVSGLATNGRPNSVSAAYSSSKWMDAYSWSANVNQALSLRDRSARQVVVNVSHREVFVQASGSVCVTLARRSFVMVCSLNAVTRVVPACII